MKKRKKKKTERSPISGYLEAEIAITVKIECNFCGEEYDNFEEPYDLEEIKDATEKLLNESEKSLKEKGWKEVTSDKFNCIALACPKCAKLPDRERGE